MTWTIFLYCGILYKRSSNYLSISFEGQTAEMFAETKPAPTLLPYPTPQKQLNQLTGRVLYVLRAYGIVNSHNTNCILDCIVTTLVVLTSDV